MRQAIESAVQIFRANPDASNDEIFCRFIDGGIERSVAAQLIVLLPLAYGRVSLSNSGVLFSDTYIGEVEPSQDRRESRLGSLPLWTEAVAFARHEASRGVAGQAFFTIASRSAEVRAINAALHDEKKLQNLVCRPTVILWSSFDSSAGCSERVTSGSARTEKVILAVVVGIAVLVGLLAIGAVVYEVISLVRASH